MFAESFAHGMLYQMLILFNLIYRSTDRYLCIASSFSTLA